jgi:hypothetical protein
MNSKTIINVPMAKRSRGIVRNDMISMESSNRKIYFIGLLKGNNWSRY